MEFYPQGSPSETQSSYSAGGGSYNFNGQIAVAPLRPPSPFFSYQAQTIQQANTRITIDICVDGMPMKLDIFAAGPPYEPEPAP
jgi:hypothetical protein